MSKQSARLERVSKALMVIGFCWIIGGGTVALVIGIQSLAAGSPFYGVGSIVLGGTVLFSSWFMWRQI